ncbi:DEAD/DEAH box helicase [Paenibacillus oryzisoli]|uniref:DEAD/DEAH box helicase n=1 Tax=Paenibacillus oryzisoli TaxID=1850517 RepID=UPI003D2AE54B
MKVGLYAVRTGTHWSWHYTVHEQTACQYWFEHYAADAGLVVFEPFVSLGQGERVLAALRGGVGAPPGEAAAGWLVGQLQVAAAACGLPAGAFEARWVSYASWRREASSVGLDAGTYRRLVEACSGRALLQEELHQCLAAQGLVLEVGREEPTWLAYLELAQLHGDVELTPGFGARVSRDWRRGLRRSLRYRCKRCGSGSDRLFWSWCASCGEDCPYCEACLTMGRVRSCSLLVRGVAAGGAAALEAADGDFSAYLAPWGLSEAQTAASREGLRYLASSRERLDGGRGPAARRFLIWAVTGAGKTEMIFPFIQYIAKQGGRVLIATPRKDVVLELQPRISRAFEAYRVVTLYGGSEERWEQGPITIATTHQLMRFYQAFDLVIIDEIDAFPYHNNPMLGFAAEQVCRPDGITILLSATPPPAVRKAVNRGRMAHVRVPVRFHRHPLPLPRFIQTPSLRRMVQAQRISKSLLVLVQQSVERGAQVFIFVPNIQLVEPVVGLLRREVSVRVEGTSSQDDLRADKVQTFRKRDIRVLVTTTILERGVTVPKSDVFILEADSGLFDDAALVQMAGRAGRSKEDPAGKVVFAAAEVTRSQKEALRQIRTMNRIARKRGFLKEDAK